MNSEKSKLQVVLDTNIYISALLFGGIPEDILEMAREKEIVLLVSSPILLEIARVLQEKFKFKNKQILDIIKEIKRISTVVFPKKKLNIIIDDPADNRIIECAIEGGADFIVSGDKHHLIPLKIYHNIPILLPADFIKSI